MKIDSRGAPKPKFDPIEIVITIESQDEMDALRKASEKSDHSMIIYDKGGYNSKIHTGIIRQFWGGLKPHVTKL